MCSTPALDVIAPDKTGPRAVRWHAAESRLEIDTRKARDSYALAEFPTRWDGRAFRLLKDGATEPYHVFVGRNPHDHSCDCPAGAYVAGPCRHVLSLQAIIRNGWLDPVPAVELPSEEEIDAMAVAAGLDADPFR